VHSASGSVKEAFLSSTQHSISKNSLPVSSFHFIEGRTIFINTTHTEQEVIARIQHPVQLIKHSFLQHNFHISEHSYILAYSDACIPR